MEQTNLASGKTRHVRRKPSGEGKRGDGGDGAAAARVGSGPKSSIRAQCLERIASRKRTLDKALSERRHELLNVATDALLDIANRLGQETRGPWPLQSKRDVALHRTPVPQGPNDVAVDLLVVGYRGCECPDRPTGAAVRHGPVVLRVAARLWRRDGDDGVGVCDAATGGDNADAVRAHYVVHVSRDRSTAGLVRCVASRRRHACFGLVLSGIANISVPARRATPSRR